MHTDISSTHLRAPPRGIRSLDQRLAYLEETKGMDDNLITRLQKAENEKIKRELSKLNESFVVSLEENVPDLDKNNLIEIISFANLFVKQNIVNIAKLCNSRKSDEFETLAIISIIISKYPTDNLEFLEKSVTTIRKLMSTEDVQQTEVESVQKKSIFSISLSKKK